MDGGEVLAAEAQPSRRDRRPHTWVWLALLIVVLVAVSALAWATFVGWDTTAKAAVLDRPCGMHVSVDGQVWSVKPRPFGAGFEYPSMRAGDRVRIHHQLFHGTSYAFLGADGSAIALWRKPDVACAGPA